MGFYWSFSIYFLFRFFMDRFFLKCILITLFILSAMLFCKSCNWLISDFIKTINNEDLYHTKFDVNVDLNSGKKSIFFSPLCWTIKMWWIMRNHTQIVIFSVSIKATVFEVESENMVVSKIICHSNWMP